MDIRCGMKCGFCYRWCGGGVVLKLLNFGFGCGGGLVVHICWSYGLHGVYGLETVLEKKLENGLERELGCG